MLERGWGGGGGSSILCAVAQVVDGGKILLICFCGGSCCLGRDGHSRPLDRLMTMLGALVNLVQHALREANRAATTPGAETPLLATLGLAVAPIVAAGVAGVVFLLTLEWKVGLAAAVFLAATPIGVSTLCGRVRPARVVAAGECGCCGGGGGPRRRLRIVR